MARIDQQPRAFGFQQPRQHPPRHRGISHGAAQETGQPILGVAGKRHGACVQREDPQVHPVARRLGHQGHGQFGIRQPGQHPRTLRCIGVVEGNRGKVVKRGHGGPSCCVNGRGLALIAGRPPDKPKLTQA